MSAAGTFDRQSFFITASVIHPRNIAARKSGFAFSMVLFATRNGCRHVTPPPRYTDLCFGDCREMLGHHGLPPRRAFDMPEFIIAIDAAIFASQIVFEECLGPQSLPPATVAEMLRELPATKSRDFRFCSQMLDVAAIGLIRLIFSLHALSADAMHSQFYAFTRTSPRIRTSAAAEWSTRRASSRPRNFRRSTRLLLILAD